MTTHRELANHKQSTELMAIAENGNLERLKALLDQFEYSDVVIASSMHGAAKNGHAEIVQLLIDKGADCNYQNGYSLNYAIRAGHVSTVKTLIDNGAICHFKSQKEAIQSVAKNGNLDMIKLLFENCGFYIEPLRDIFSCACESGNFELVKYIFDYASNFPKGIFLTIFETAPLIHAAKSGNIEIVHFLLNQEDYNYKSDIDEAVVYAAENGHLEIVQCLVDKGANTRDNSNVSNSSSFFYRPTSAIAQATIHGHLNVVKYLVEKDAAKKSGMKVKIIELAARQGHIEIVEFMLSIVKKVNLNKAVRNAISYKRDDIARLLIKHMIKYTKPDEDAICDMVLKLLYTQRQ